MTAVNLNGIAERVVLRAQQKGYVARARCARS